MMFTASSCCLLVSSLLLLGGAQATFNHQDKNDKNNGEEPLENEARTYLQARHSPFHVRSSKELNRALAILEHESQSWYARGNGDGDRWWADDEGRDNGHNHKDGDNGDATARGQRNNKKKKNNNKKDEERDYFYGRIQIEKTGDYYLDRDFIFSDGFKLEIAGVHGEPKHHHHHDKHDHDKHEKKEKGEEVVIHAAPNKRHFTFDDHAILKACDLTFVDGGCDKEGFYGGSMLFVNRATGKFEDVHFRDNTAWVGGAIYAENARWLDFHRGSFQHNHADRKGGAVALEEERAQNNKKKNHHGRERGVGSARDNDKNDKYNKRALYHDNGDNDNDAFGSSSNNDDNDNKNKNHKNEKRGRRVTRVHFNRVTFTNNEADLGGALFNGGSLTDVEDSHFAHNHARLGGAVYNNHRGRLLIRGSSFYANEASAKGGAIFNAGRVWIVCSRFQDNEAPVGCDIFNNGELKCSASTDHVKIDGSGEGYCHACVQPVTAGPTMKSTPKRRVKKDNNEDKKDKDHHDKDGGLFGGLFGKNGKDWKGDDESRFVYDYYQHGGSTAFDRWNGDYNAWDAEEADAHKDYAH